VVAEPGGQSLTGPEAWWAIVLGTGYRATVERLGAEAAERVRAVNLAQIELRTVREIETNVVYALARKPDQ
jgi:hypothetical protein